MSQYHWPSMNELEKTFQNWTRTQLVGERLRLHPDFQPPIPGDPTAPYGWFGSRPVIGRDMPVLGGVYLGAGPREAIVIEDRSEDEGDRALRLTYTQHFLPFLERMADSRHVRPKDDALKAVHLYTQRVFLNNDLDQAYALIPRHIPDVKIHLASFIAARTGACRHRALFATYLVGKLRAEKGADYRLTGKESIDRNQLALDLEGQHGAHAWLRYVTSSSQIWISDPMQNVFGPLSELIQGPKKSRWNYARPEDLR